MSTKDSATFIDLLGSALGERDSFHLVRRLAASLISKNIASGPPFNPVAYAGHFGIRVVEAKIPSDGFLTTGAKLTSHLSQFGSIIKAIKTFSTIGLSGKTCSDVRFAPEDTIIVVRDRLSSTIPSQRRKIRFVVAHEFAHWYLRTKIGSSIGQTSFPEDDPDEEMLCDLFAAELLVPTAMFLEDISEPNFAPEMSPRLTDKYDVSLATLLVKAAALSRNYAAFALYNKKASSLETSFTTPARQRAVFADEQIRSDVDSLFQSESEERYCTYNVSINGRATQVQAHHVAIENRTRVLSFIHAKPFEAREVVKAPAHDGRQMTYEEDETRFASRHAVACA